MSISGISGQASSIQVDIRLSQGRAAGAGGHCHACNDGDGDDSGAGASSGTASGAGASSFATLAQQIQTTVDSAVKNLDPSESNNPLDVIKTILEALDQALKQNSTAGSDSTDPFQTVGDGTATVDPTSSLGTTAASDGSTSTGQSSTDSTTATAADGTTPASQQSPLQTLLSQFGIDPNQFKADLLSALGGSNNGTVDFSIVFKNFPVGQSINAQA